MFLCVCVDSLYVAYTCRCLFIAVDNIRESCQQFYIAVRVNLNLSDVSFRVYLCTFCKFVTHVPKSQVWRSNIERAFNSKNRANVSLRLDSIRQTCCEHVFDKKSLWVSQKQLWHDWSAHNVSSQQVCIMEYSHYYMFHVGCFIPNQCLINRVSTTPGNTGNLLEFCCCSWKDL